MSVDEPTKLPGMERALPKTSSAEDACRSSLKVVLRPRSTQGNWSVHLSTMAATAVVDETLGTSRVGDSAGPSSTGARERVSATTLSFPAIGRMSVVYSEMFDSWVVCRLLCGSNFFLMAGISEF